MAKRDALTDVHEIFTTQDSGSPDVVTINGKPVKITSFKGGETRKR